MSTTILPENVYVVNAVNEFMRRYPAFEHERADVMEFATSLVERGSIIDNEDHTFTVKGLRIFGAEYTVARQGCNCYQPRICAHRIAVNIANIALQLRGAQSEFQLDRAEIAEACRD